jgi:hypothetical protein
MTIANGSTSWEGRIRGLKTIILKTENSKLISIGHQHIKKLMVFARDQNKNVGNKYWKKDSNVILNKI